MAYIDSGDYTWPTGSEGDAQQHPLIDVLTSLAPMIDEITSMEPAKLADPQDGFSAGPLAIPITRTPPEEIDCRTIDKKLRAEIAAALTPIYGQLSRIEALLDGTTLREQYTK